MVRRKKVLLLLHELSRTGAPRSVLDGFEAMRDEFEVRMIVPHAGPLKDDCQGIGPLSILDGILPHGRIWQRVYGRVQWRRWVRELHRWAPDLIYINSVASLPIARIVPLPEAPAILHVRELHSELLPIMKECANLLTQMPMRYIAVSDAVRRRPGDGVWHRPGSYRSY